MDSSSGAATVSAMTLGFAPGYWARTTTEGGTTSGYSEMGSWNTANAPASRIRTDSTPAKMGRSIKNLEMFMRVLSVQELSIDSDGFAPDAAILGGWVANTGRGVTTSPGRMRCRPLTTMRSPAFKPA